MQSGLDREVEKTFRELQKAYNCIIMLVDDTVDVLFLETGVIKCFTVRTEYKDQTILDIRRMFRTFK